jgi:hypothetical protein
MTRILTSVALACALLATGAQARTTPNPAVHPTRDPFAAPGIESRESVSLATAAATAVVPAPLPAGAVQLDSVWYDLQDMGSLGTRIVIGPDGRVHVTWQDDFCELGGGCPPNLNAPQPFPNRAMAYAVRDTFGVWSHLARVQDPLLRNCCVTDLAGGFGAIALASGGRAVVSQHLNEDGCDLRGNFYLEDSPGAASWTGYLTPIVSPSYLFPSVVANPNGSYTVLAEVPKGGQYDEVADMRVSYLPAAGTRFVCPVGWQCGAWAAIAPTTLFRDGQPAFPSIAVSSNGRVGVAVGDFGGNVTLIESSNGSFAPGTITIRALTHDLDAAIIKGDSTSAEYRPYVNCQLAYNDTTPNVVWSELQARRVGTSLTYADFHSRIMHWDPIRGVEAVKQVTAGEADRFDDVDQGLAGPLAGFNTLAVDWPQVGFSSDGRETYVAFLRFSDAEVDPTADTGLPGIVTGVGFGDIACSVTRAGEAWSVPQNLTNTPATDERFFSLAARNPGGHVHVVFQASATNQAGCAIIGDRGTSPGTLLRRIAYLDRALNASLVAVPPSPRAAAPGLLAWPNPTRGRVRFSVPPSEEPTSASLVVTGVDGRLVARVMLARGEAEWDGRDAAGRRAAPGIYFARLAAPASRSVRFTLLH